MGVFGLRRLRALILYIRYKSFSTTTHGLKGTRSTIDATVTGLRVSTTVRVFSHSAHVPALAPRNGHLCVRSLGLLSRTGSVRAVVRSFDTNMRSALAVTVGRVLLAPTFCGMVGTFCRRFPRARLRVGAIRGRRVDMRISRKGTSVKFVLYKSVLPGSIRLNLINCLPIAVTTTGGRPLRSRRSVRLRRLGTFHRVLFAGVRDP